MFDFILVLLQFHAQTFHISFEWSWKQPLLRLIIVLQAETICACIYCFMCQVSRDHERGKHALVLNKD